MDVISIFTGFFMATVVIGGLSWWYNWQERKRRTYAERALAVKTATDALPNVVKEDCLVSGHNVSFVYDDLQKMIQSTGEKVHGRIIELPRVRDIVQALERTRTQISDRPQTQSLPQTLQRALELVKALSPGNDLIQALQLARDQIRALEWARHHATTWLRDIENSNYLPQIKELYASIIKIIIMFLDIWPVLTLRSPLGEGRQGTVFRVLLGEDQYAVKIFTPQGENINILIEEVYKRFHREKLVEKYRHDNIVALHHFFQNIQVTSVDRQTATRLYLPAYTMDLYEESLNNYVERQRKQQSLTDTVLENIEVAKQLLKYLLDASNGLEYMHSKEIGLVHQDIKPGNIMLKEGKAAIADFGVAFWHTGKGQDDQPDRYDDSRYIAPEIEGDRPRYTAAADVYSFGITILELCFFTRDSQAISISRNHCNKLAGSLEKIGNYLLDLIEAMCKSWPNKRPEITEVKQRLQEIAEALGNPEKARAIAPENETVVETQSMIEQYSKILTTSLNLQERVDAFEKLVRLGQTSFQRIDLSSKSKDYRANLQQLNLPQCDFAKARLIRADFAKANLQSTNLCKANLFVANLAEANLVEADLSGANLEAAKMEKANLTGAKMTSANLFVANLEAADCSGINFVQANLAGTNLQRSKLTKANLQQARLAGADFSETNLSEANLAGADLTGCRHLTVEQICTCSSIEEIKGLSRQFLEQVKAKKAGLVSWWDGEDRSIEATWLSD